jgi:ABC-type phosphate/phosphonate transport system substrate-binding protein
MMRQATWYRLLALGLAVAVCAAIAESRAGRQLNSLRIGTSGTLTSEGGGKDEKSSLDTLKSFIKDESQLESEINRQKDWQELASKMAKGDLEVGVFHGFEYAWAQQRMPELKPLAVAVNIHPYPVVSIMVGRDDPAKDFASLQGQTITMVSGGAGTIHLYVDRQCQAAGKKPEAFFSKISSRDNFEDALDDVVDGAVTATAADRAALEAYKRRKPGRFNKLKPISQSEPFPPPVIAYYGDHLDDGTKKQFRDGLLGASGKEKGQTMLTLFRLTGFQMPPADFDKVLTATRTAYPPANESGKEK